MLLRLPTEWASERPGHTYLHQNPINLPVSTHNGVTHCCVLQPGVTECRARVLEDGRCSPPASAVGGVWDHAWSHPEGSFNQICTQDVTRPRLSSSARPVEPPAVGTLPYPQLAAVAPRGASVTCCGDTKPAWPGGARRKGFLAAGSGCWNGSGVRKGTRI